MDVWGGFLRTFIPLFVALDPVGLAAIFLGMSREIERSRRQRIAAEATLTGGVVALLFLFLGKSLFGILGITVGDFQIAGGLILLLLASADLAKPAAEAPPRLADGFGVVPLGMPLIAGPALITTLLLLSETEGIALTLAALAANLALAALGFAFAGPLERAMGATGMRAVSKIVSLLLAAIAVHMIRQGWK